MFNSIRYLSLKNKGAKLMVALAEISLDHQSVGFILEENLTCVPKLVHLFNSLQYM